MGLTTTAVKVHVIKANNASITEHKPGHTAGPDRSQDAAAGMGVTATGAESETHLLCQLPTEHLELEAVWIPEVAAVRLSGQEDAELHLLLQHGGCGRLHHDVIVQLHREKETQGDTV